MDRARYRLLRTLEDFEHCVRIQRDVWRHSDIDITPIHNLRVSVEMGAILIGAFVGPTMAGYVYSFPAVFRGKSCQHSHHLAVLSEYRGRGLGKMLKKVQGTEALKRGYKLITWTCDPLQARNANLNLHTLGAQGRTYLDNFYGCTPTLMLDSDVPTDRLLLEWRIASSRVRERWTRKDGPPDPSGIAAALERKPDGNPPHFEPGPPDLSLREARIRIELPAHIRDLKTVPDLIGRWQKAVRSALKHYFAKGYRLDDFIFAERSFYVLRRESSRRRG